MTGWRIMLDARPSTDGDLARQHALLLAELPSALHRAGHSVCVLAHAGQSTPPGCDVVETPAPAVAAPAADFFALTNWPRLVAQQGAQLVVGLHGLVPLGRMEARRVAAIHDVSAVRAPQLGNPATRLALGTRLAAACTATQAVVTPSRWLADEIRLVHPHASLHPIPPLLQAAPVQRGSRARLNALGVVPDLYLCVPFTAQAHKALPVLLEAFGALPLDWDVQLLLLGTAAQWRAQDHIHLLPEERVDAVILTDDLDPATRVDVLTHAGAVLLPAWHDGALLGAMDAVAMGTPIISSPHTAAHELIGRHVPVVEPWDVDGWTTAMEDALHRKAHKKRASNADKVVAAWLAVFSGVMR